MEQPVEYGGFWARALAQVIDAILIAVVTLPLLAAIYGFDYFRSDRAFHGIWDILLDSVFPPAAVILFWIFKSATPGKMALALRIADARSGGRPSIWQYIGRYAAYFVSALPFGLGFFWAAFHDRKQGWHDLLAKTLVVYESEERARFDHPPE